MCVKVSIVEKTSGGTAVFFSAFVGDQRLSVKMIAKVIQVYMHSLHRCRISLKYLSIANKTACLTVSCTSFNFCMHEMILFQAEKERGNIEAVEFEVSLMSSEEYFGLDKPHDGVSDINVAVIGGVAGGIIFLLLILIIAIM